MTDDQEISKLASQTKLQTYVFSERVHKAEDRIFYFSCFEMAVMVVVGIWQVRSVRDIMVKRQVV